MAVAVTTTELVRPYVTRDAKKVARNFISWLAFSISNVSHRFAKRVNMRREAQFLKDVAERGSCFHHKCLVLRIGLQWFREWFSVPFAGDQMASNADRIGRVSACAA